MGLAVQPTAGRCLCNERPQKRIDHDLHADRRRRHDRPGAYRHSANESAPVTRDSARHKIIGGATQPPRPRASAACFAGPHSPWSLPLPPPAPQRIALSCSPASRGHLGLQDSHCPLCAAPRTPDQFNAALRNARARLAKRGKRLAASSRSAAEARSAVDAATQALTVASRRLADEVQRRLTAQQRLEAIRTVYERNSFRGQVVIQMQPKPSY